MDFTSIRIITSDVDRLVAFYERLLDATFARPHPLFAQLDGPAVLAISSDATVPAMGDGIAEAATNRSVIVEFQVADVDAEFTRVGHWAEVAMPPRTMPWGNRSLLLRDPDGTLVNLFSRPA